MVTSLVTGGAEFLGSHLCDRVIKLSENDFLARRPDINRVFKVQGFGADNRFQTRIGQNNRILKI